MTDHLRLGHVVWLSAAGVAFAFIFSQGAIFAIKQAGGIRASITRSCEFVGALAVPYQRFQPALCFRGDQVFPAPNIKYMPRYIWQKTATWEASND